MAPEDKGDGSRGQGPGARERNPAPALPQPRDPSPGLRAPLSPDREELETFLLRHHGEIGELEHSPEGIGIRLRFRAGGRPREVFLMPYRARLAKVAEEGELTGEDEGLARDLAESLAEVHHPRRFEPELYRISVRSDIDDFLAVLDSLSHGEELSGDEAAELAVKAARWWGRLRLLPGRLSAVWEGEFPGDIWAGGPDILLRTRRAGAGEPAGNLASGAFLYIDLSLTSLGRFDEPFRHLFLAFFGRYLEASRDDAVLGVLPFYIAARSLRAANDIIAKDDAGSWKRRYIDLAWNILEEEEFRVEDLPDLLR